MNGIFPRFAVALAAFAAVACSDTGYPEQTRAPGSAVASFSAADKLAARALSIGNRDAIQRAKGPYAQALLCRNAVGSIAAQFREGNALGEEQLQAITQAGTIYDRRLRALAEQQGRSRNAIADDLERTATDNPDLSANARTAIACLQQL